MPIRIVATSPTRKRQGRRGQFGGAKKYVPDVAKSAQHPHSRLKTQKELKKITDSAEYKKGDYKKQTEMLGGKTWTAQEMETKIKNKKPKSYSWNKTRILKAKGGRTGFKSGTLTLGKKGRRGIKSIHEQLGGSEKAKPHSTKEGRVASGKRRLERLHRKAMSDYHDITWAGPDREKGKPHSSQEGQIATGRRNFRRALQRHVGGAKPLRAKHGLGSLVRKVITKIKPKPKPKPGAVKDVNVDKLLKNLGDEIKAAPLPPQLKKSLDKLKKAYPHKKARGGRIGLQHGSRPRPSGPHTWVRSGGAVLKGKKVGIQIK